MLQRSARYDIVSVQVLLVYGQIVQLSRQDSPPLGTYLALDQVQICRIFPKMAFVWRTFYPPLRSMPFIFNRGVIFLYEYALLIYDMF